VQWEGRVSFTSKQRYVQSSLSAKGLLLCQVFTKRLPRWVVVVWTNFVACDFNWFLVVADNPPSWTWKNFMRACLPSWYSRYAKLLVLSPSCISQEGRAATKGKEKAFKACKCLLRLWGGLAIFLLFKGREKGREKAIKSASACSVFVVAWQDFYFPCRRSSANGEPVYRPLIGRKDDSI
jgi:hypothetical protein